MSEQQQVPSDQTLGLVYHGAKTEYRSIHGDPTTIQEMEALTAAGLRRVLAEFGNPVSAPVIPTVEQIGKLIYEEAVVSAPGHYWDPWEDLDDREVKDCCYAAARSVLKLFGISWVNYTLEGSFSDLLARPDNPESNCNGTDAENTDATPPHSTPDQRTVDYNRGREDGVAMGYMRGEADARAIMSPVPVSERLPEERDLAEWPDGEGKPWCWFGRMIHDDGEHYFQWIQCQPGFGVEYKFTHWRPAHDLPLPEEAK